MSWNPSTGERVRSRPAIAALVALCVLGVSVALVTAGGVAGHPAATSTTTNDRFEPNDEFSTATSLPAGDYADLLIAAGESDFFAIDLEQGQSLTARINFSHSEGNLDVRVSDPSQQQIGSSTTTTDDESVTVTAEETGTYYVEVYGVSDAEAAYDLSIQTSASNDAPSAALTVTPQSAAVGEQVTFDASNSTDSDGTIQAYRWDFDGDGTIDETTGSSTPETTHTYNSTGSYNAVVTVVDDDEATDSATRDVLVTEPTTPPPEASCSVAPTQVEPGDTVEFDATASENASSADFDLDGDGTYEIRNESSLLATYQYQNPGTYPVSVRVANEAGQDTAECGTVTVEANQPPTARLTATPQSTTPGTSVTFDASNSTDSDGTIQTYRWDFDGDGTVDETTVRPTASTTHSYASTGSYNAVVTVVDDDEATDSATRDVLVTEPTTPPPEASCSVAPTEVEPGDTVELDATASENASSADFDVDGDGTYEIRNESSLLATYQYQNPGTYPVSVRVANEGGQDTAECGTVTVEANQPPTARLAVTPQFGSPGEPLTFDASNSTDPDGTIQAYRWDFDGDGTVDETTVRPTASTTHSYASTGSYNAVVIVVDDDNATDSATRDVGIDGERDVTCSVTPTTIEVGGSVTVNASGSQGFDIVEFDVDGDGQYERTDSDDFVITPQYNSSGQYPVRARAGSGERAQVAECGTVTVEANQPPNAKLTVSPQSPRVGTSVTLDASASSDPDGRVVRYRWDFDGDGTVDRRTNASQTTVAYNTAGLANAAVTVVDDDGATDRAVRDVVVETPQTSPGTETPPRTSEAPGSETPQFDVRCRLRSETDADDTIVVDASESKGVTAVRYDFDGDGDYDTDETTDFVRNHTYDSPGQYQVRVQGVGEGGRATAECGTTDIAGGDGGSSGYPIPDDPLPWVVTLLALGGLGGGAYYWLGRGDDGGTEPGGGGTAPGGGGTPPGGGPVPKPPTVRDEETQAMYETGTFLTPPSSGPVTVSGLGFEPALILLTASTNVRPSGGTAPERSDGWSYGTAVRDDDGSLRQTTVSLTDDTDSLDAALGASADGVAIELDVHYDDVPDRLTGQVTKTTDDGFEMSFDVSGLRGERADDQYLVHYQAFTFGPNTAIEVGHFRTPTFPGSQTVDLGIDADHVALLATNALSGVGDRAATDLPVGFSIGDVVGRTDPAQLVRTATLEPSGPTGTGTAAFEGRGLHLQFAYEGRIRGRTTARVTSLGSSIDLEYEKVYNGPAKLGSTDRTLVTYVAMETRDLQPALGYFQLPEAGSDHPLAIEVGFEPGLVEFTTLGGSSVDDESFQRASPFGFDWSHGTVIGTGDSGLRHYVVSDTVDPGTSTHEPHADAGRGVAAAVRTIGDGGYVTGHVDLTVTARTDTGFEVAVTDCQTRRETTGERPYVLYKAWPDPETQTRTVPDQGADDAQSTGNAGPAPRSDRQSRQ